ncbi:MAG TPA: OmpA family protein [Vicinamibacterales bacterium]
MNRRRSAFCTVGALVMPWLLCAKAPQEPSAAAACAPSKDAAFGTATKTVVSMEGKIYFLPAESEKLPDFATLKTQGSIYTDDWDIDARDFTSGFPGVTNRFEWFAIDYQGSIFVPVAGEYGFRLSSDDGSKLYLDGKVVVDDDGVHGMTDQTGSATLTQGDHPFRLSYFQGPATTIGLQLFVTPPGAEEKIFRLQDFDKSVLEQRRLLGVEENDKEIRVRFGAEVLFDTGKYDLKPAAQESLNELAALLRGYPAHPIVIEGHTDNVGTEKSNQLLSENRAKSVKSWLVAQGQVPGLCISTAGFGATQPVAGNDTAEGRQKNRRVEVKIEKGERGG